MAYTEKRITKLRSYLFEIINRLKDNNKQINANFLSDDINNYSLDKIPINTQVNNWIIDGGVYRDLYSFRSRMSYSQDTINNLKNIGFFEDFEEIINSNNDEGVLPDIDGIESIKCLNCGTMNNVQSNTAEFDIQIQITYRKNNEGGIVSI